MNTYKITNLTNFAGKRETKYNSTLDIEYVDSMMTKTIKVKPGETVYLQISSLPLSVHRLRVKKLISVVEIGESELKNNIDALKPASVKKPEVVVENVDKKIVEVKKKLVQKQVGDKVSDTE